MNKTPYLDTLSDAERQELRLCGICEDAQLNKVLAAQLWKDIQQAHMFFPDKEFVLTEERIQQIVTNAPQIEEEITPLEPQSRKKELIIERAPAKSDFFHTVSADGRDANINPETTTERLMHAEKVNGLSRDFHAICCNHPHAVYLAAGATVILIPAMFLLVAIPIMLFYGIEPLGNNPIHYAIAILALFVPYVFTVYMANCSVCHIRLFTFRPYPHHKGAHHLPILGSTFATALHILFFFQFRCPACGTQMKLFGRSSRRRRTKKEIRRRNREQKELYQNSTQKKS